MARYTRYLFWVSVAGTVIAAIGLYFIGRSLRHGELAATGARQAAEAALEQVRQTRAWVAILQPEVFFEKGELWVKVPLQNYGASPALRVKATLDFRSVSNPAFSTDTVREECGYVAHGARTDMIYRFNSSMAGDLGARSIMSLSVEYHNVLDEEGSRRSCTSGDFELVREIVSIVPERGATYADSYSVRMYPSSCMMS
jgi:hypothetical protein